MFLTFLAFAILVDLAEIGITLVVLERATVFLIVCITIGQFELAVFSGTSFFIAYNLDSIIDRLQVPTKFDKLVVSFALAALSRTSITL